jgi:centractin
MCFISGEPYVEGKNYQVPEVQYELPDKKKVILGEEQFLAPEILFNPELMGSEYKSVDKV